MLDETRGVIVATGRGRVSDDSGGTLPADAVDAGRISGERRATGETSRTFAEDERWAEVNVGFSCCGTEKGG